MSESLRVFDKPLSPLTLLERTLHVFPQQSAVVYGERQWTWEAFGQEIGRFAGALRRAGVGPGDRVAFLAPNVPELLAAHFAVLQVHGVLVAINTRLKSEEVGYILNHSGAKLVMADPELAPIIRDIPHTLDANPSFVNVEDPVAGFTGTPLDGPTFEEFVDGAPVLPVVNDIDDEFRTTSINYTSGTTGFPEGRHVFHARGAWVNAAGAKRSHHGHRTATVELPCGRFRCSTATAGAFRGPCRASAASM